jgi:Lon protease-like protein
MPTQLTDASWVGYRLAEILPLSLDDKLGLLELDEPLARLERLSRLMRRVAG